MGVLIKDANFNMRINKQKKSELEALYSRLGMTLPEAVNIFFEKSLLDGGIPFDVRLPRYNRETEEAMQEAAEKVYALQSVYNVQNDKQLENFLTDIGHTNPYDTPETDRLLAELEEAAAAWQRTILEWYDIWAEIVQENAKMFDNNQTFSDME